MIIMKHGFYIGPHTLAYPRFMRRIDAGNDMRFAYDVLFVMRAHEHRLDDYGRGKIGNRRTRR